MKRSEEHWSDLVKTYFYWHQLVYKQSPIFKGSAPRDLRLITAMLRENTLYWDLKTAKNRLYFFLDYAYESEPFLRDHWSLAELYKMRKEIFNNWTK